QPGASRSMTLARLCLRRGSLRFRCGLQLALLGTRLQSEAFHGLGLLLLDAPEEDAAAPVVVRPSGLYCQAAQLEHARPLHWPMSSKSSAMSAPPTLDCIKEGSGLSKDDFKWHLDKEPLPGAHVS
ncbi:unnamed protein product, partial [Symbiodinium sp. CCMP2456]